MKNINLKAPAKLNLSLNLLPEKGEMDYYKVHFINIQVDLFDTITIQKLPCPGVILEGEMTGKKNLAYQAARMIHRTCHLSHGVKIFLTKNIPTKAGLGGGSADAAAVINGLIRMFELQVDHSQKAALAKKLGMDVCYCITGGLAIVSGIGDKVNKLEIDPPFMYILIATPPVTKPSTGWAYSIIDKTRIGKNLEKSKRLLKGIRNKNIETVSENLHNDFEGPIEREFPVTGYIKKTMLQQGALNALLAGSGLSIFGIFKTTPPLMVAKSQLENNNIRCFITTPIFNKGNLSFPEKSY
ncbi:MAG: 4-(cytidine 5'-diphospho)-2-C-methyl-D-erythritol kinase [Spirochaetota bacterium]